VESLLWVGSGPPEWKRVRSHLLKCGFRVVTRQQSELDRSEEGEANRCVLGLLDATGSTALHTLMDAIRQQEAYRKLPWIAIIHPHRAKELEGVPHIEDFVTVPLDPQILEARIRLVLRRLNHPLPGHVIQIGALRLDPDRYELTLKGEPLELTYKEFELIKFLATHPGRVFSRDQLLNEVWGYNFIGGTRTVDVHIRRLRAKLGPQYACLIATVRNVGYKFLESI